MARYRVGFIGTGNPLQRGPMGYGMANEHAVAYKKLRSCQIVACADIKEENAKAFKKKFKVATTYLNYQEMLEKENLDIVSICTWPNLHSQMVIDSAVAGVKAIHCEKPMADTWGAARLMAQECDRRGVQLTFNHQRRFGAPFQNARKLIKEGAIGEIQSLQAACGNLFDYGTHSIDLCNMLAGDVPIKWVISQIDYRDEKIMFGAHIENQALTQWEYSSGAIGLVATGPGSKLIACHNLARGTEGEIQIGPHGEGLPALRIRRYSGKKAGQWETIDCGDEGMHGPGYINRAINDMVESLQKGIEPELSARKALNVTEIIFAAYESSRIRGRIDLPLTIQDNPLISMIQSGELDPEAELDKDVPF
ncbi:MAG: Gfo/Idh/MocA family oxidoreductase [Planctomycetota bacterium]|nr:Gfo/Idh/MocA family oxidoreductase [Planctomycetota bacterium]MDA1142727.1 Gfo/Idh/MocA family oxidoreductase [Planctomycetota bacterium]